MSRRSLPVTIPQNFTSTFFYAIPVACLRADPDYDDWYFMNYLDFYGYRNEVNNSKYEFRWLDAVSYIDCYAHVNEAVQVNKWNLHYFKEEGLIPFIKDSIDKWNYIVLFVDESKMPDSPFGNVEHEYLIYGYNDDAQTLNLMGMNQRRAYTVFEYPYDVVCRGFGSYYHRHDRPAMYQLCITNRYTSMANGENRYYSHHIDRIYDERVFEHKMNCYVNGRVSQGNVKIINSSINTALACGIDTYEIFRHYLNSVERGDNGMDFNLPFFLLDGKRGIMERLKYAYRKTGKEKYLTTAEKYDEVIRTCNLFKHIHMKQKFVKSLDMSGLKKLLCELERSERAALSVFA